MFGLSDADIAIIRDVLANYPQVNEGIIFGSRAKGNYSNGSDVDIALKGDEVDYNLVLKISAELNEETVLPYRFDIVDYHSIESVELMNHIDRVGIAFYKSE
jgi:predicted nucleotidyltransferase